MVGFKVRDLATRVQITAVPSERHNVHNFYKAKKQSENGMRLTIDTNADSREDIQRAIRLLSSLINHESTSELVEEEPQKTPSVFDLPAPNIMAIFDAETKAPKPNLKRELPMMEIY